MKFGESPRGAIFDYASSTTVIHAPAPRPANEPLSSAEVEALRGASGQAVDESDKQHAMYRDLELRGYLRRIVSFDPTRYEPGDTAPRFSWTRTEQAESLLVRLSSWGNVAI